MKLKTIGRITGGTRVEILPRYAAGLHGIEQFSHVIVFLWLHRSDRRRLRATLRVHPCANPDNPLTGVFATRSPRRPNPIGVFVTALRDVDGTVLTVDPIEAFDGTPVLDVKPYIPVSDAFADARVPWWVGRRARDEA